jgi:hypothetical protein
MAGSIGIKQANGVFYSILDENSKVKKRLVLTTVHNNQKNVQIDLYRSITKTMSDALYIGSIVINNISSKTKGEASIEMILGFGKDSTVNVTAVDLGNPSNKHNLSVSLQSFEDDDSEYPDFDTDEDRDSIDDTTAKAGGKSSSNIFKKNNDFLEKGYDSINKQKFPWFIVIIAGILLVALCLVLWFCLLRNRFTEVKPTAALPVIHNSTEGIEQPIIIERAPKADPQAVDREPQTIPSERILDRIRQGDTLWDISEAYYRNPRLYSLIAGSNNIQNPNLIIPGAELAIHPKN